MPTAAAGLERLQDGAKGELPAGRNGSAVEPDQTAAARPASI